MTSDYSPYDDLDYPYTPTSRKDPIHQPETFDDYVEFLKIANTVKTALIKQAKSDATLHCLRVLGAVIHQQVKLGVLRKECGMLLFETVRHEAIYQGVIDKRDY